ncbi:DUF4349 domain-containing protein [Cloacibacterium sp. TD35]|uniref:DUF4349 domain-containing protein n=1 Tax=Cloacibacterium sp. TD35 TaxID=2976818 RepID=UPI00237E4C07|nr:DUF4349 domain-containing protein [Cloacibacterium sp. TD35]WDT68445.1 DUF4349 domain-containing protein [Cloacibacterium sp. TD35]
MNTKFQKLVFAIFILAGLFSCQKSESVAAEYESAAMTVDSTSVQNDKVSYAASQKILDKKFVKTAEVSMEVKDVYEATVHIENALKNLGGFVTKSELQSQVIGEETYNTSDQNAVLLRKFNSYNKMQVRVPSEKLGAFLNAINDRKLFLNTRIISAEDVTNNAKIAELELKKINKTGEVISQMKTNEKKANLTEENEEKNNTQQIENLNLADNIKYSTVDIYIKEPKVRIAEIAITNTQFYDNKYQVNFFYEAKSSLLNGFYFVQKFFVFLLNFWPLFVGILIVIYFVKYNLTTLMFPKKISKSENIEK